MRSRTPKKIAVSGHELTYYRKGAGDPVLLVHGILSYSFIWEPVLLLLSEQFDTIAVDLLGCGDSAKPLDVPYSIVQHTEILSGFAAALDLKKFHLIGHDIGGGIAQRFAVAHPEQLHDIVLVNTVGYDLWPVQPIVAARTPILRQLLMAALDLGALRLVLRRAIHHKERITNELIAAFARQFRTPAGRRAFLHFANSLSNKHLLEIQDDLRRLQVPVLIVRGDEDPFLSAEISERLSEDIPGARLVRTATASHYLQIDEPEWLVEELLKFMKGKADDGT